MSEKPYRFIKHGKIFLILMIVILAIVLFQIIVPKKEKVKKREIKSISIALEEPLFTDESRDFSKEVERKTEREKEQSLETKRVVPTPYLKRNSNIEESKEEGITRVPIRVELDHNQRVFSGEKIITAGTILPAILAIAINSDLPSRLIVGRIMQNIYDSLTGKTLLIPQGSKVIGYYDSQLAYGQSRLFVVWQRIIFPNGESLLLDRMDGIDLTGEAGFSGKTDTHFMRLLSGVVLSSGMMAATSATEQGAQDRIENRMSMSAVKQASQLTNKIADKNMSVAPTIHIPIGYQFNIMVNSDLKLSGYGDK